MSPWKLVSLPRRATWMLSVVGLLIFLAGNLALPRSQASTPPPAQEVNLPANFSQALVVSGISNPTTMDFAPDGRLFVCQQNGNLRIIKDDILLTTPFLTVTVSSAGERGLIGLTFDPNFAVNRFIYVYYTATSPTIHNRISRFTANGDVAVPGSERILVDLPATTNTNHNGGALHFGPDGKLYIAVGEDGVPSRAQDLANPFGKILRINADGTIPTDNPFFNSTTGISRAIWAYGLRNPFTFGFQPGSGRMFINDVGQNTWEEINDGIVGSNYGWPTTEGATTNPLFRSPIYAYPHGVGTFSGCSIIGSTFYNPTTVRFPQQYVGSYFFADYCSGWINRLDPLNGNQVTNFHTGFSSAVDVRTANDGRLYVLTRGNGGAVYRIDYNGPTQVPQITQQPASQTVAVGQTATFTVTASGQQLSYQWQKNSANISGAINASYTTPATTLQDNNAQFRCVVSNAAGTATSDPATLTVVNSQPPSPTIVTPTVGTLYTAGDTIFYSGTATDPDEGTLAGSAFTWWVDFHHDTHTHPHVLPTTGSTSGSFVIPTGGETASNVWYRIYLRVTDATGLSTTVFREIFPRTATITLASNPSGLALTLDGQPVTAPFNFVGVAGIIRTLGVVSPQTVGGTQYQFVSWSNGGAATQNISTPLINTTYTASFQAVPQSPTITTHPANQTVSVGQPATFTVAATGTPSPSYQWQRNSININGATSASYTLASTSVSDNGALFRCVVSNSQGSATSNQATLTVVSGPQAFAISSDAYVRNGSFANANYGRVNALYANNSNSAGAARVSYLQVTLQNVSPTFTSAKLRVYGRLLNSLQRNIGVSVYPVASTTWQETTITWNNRPAAGATALGSATIVNNQFRWYELDVTSYVRSELQAGRSTISLMLAIPVLNTKTYPTFNSREALTNRPEIVVTF